MVLYSRLKQLLAIGRRLVVGGGRSPTDQADNGLFGGQTKEGFYKLVKSNEALAGVTTANEWCNGEVGGSMLLPRC